LLPLTPLSPAAVSRGFLATARLSCNDWFSHFDVMHECNGQTDGLTDGKNDIPGLHAAFCPIQSLQLHHHHHHLRNLWCAYYNTSEQMHYKCHNIIDVTTSSNVPKNQYISEKIKMF